MDVLLKIEIKGPRTELRTLNQNYKLSQNCKQTELRTNWRFDSFSSILGFTPHTPHRGLWNDTEGTSVDSSV